MSTREMAEASPDKSTFVPDMSWTRSIPPGKQLNCVAAADDVLTQAERKLAQVERTGLDRAEIRAAAFLRRVRPEKDIEGLTVENTGRMGLNMQTLDEEEKNQGVVPCTALWQRGLKQ